MENHRAIERMTEQASQWATKWNTTSKIQLRYTLKSCYTTTKLLHFSRFITDTVRDTKSNILEEIEWVEYRGGKQERLQMKNMERLNEKKKMNSMIAKIESKCNFCDILKKIRFVLVYSYRSFTSCWNYICKFCCSHDIWLKINLIFPLNSQWQASRLQFAIY